MDATAPLTGKVALVTGASSGIGKETARGLARLGATVVLACRNAERGEAARDDIVRDTGNPDVELVLADLERLDEVRRVARDFRERHAALHVLVNNAGFHTAERTITPDGYESTFAVNHLAHFLLTDLLLDPLRTGAPSRVVTVASEAHRLGGHVDFDDLMGEKRWSGWKAYAQAKLANLVFALELARRLRGTGVTSNALHPGVVRTGWGRGKESGVLRGLVALAAPALLSPAKGARTSLHLAASPNVEGVTGRYFVRRRPFPPSREARDPDVGRRLWDVSAELVGLEP